MTKIRCTHCNDIIEGDGKGTFITCSCGKIYVDETKWYCRVGGNKDDFEVMRWCYKCNKLYPLNEKYWYWTSAKHQRYKTLCRKCSNYESKISHRINRALKKELQ